MNGQQNDRVVVARRLLIRGVVQGVGFRWFFVGEARRRGLDGWVRNLIDGRVEALVCGPQGAVVSMLMWALAGPPGARVDEVLVEDSAERPQGFERRGTARLME